MTINEFMIKNNIRKKNTVIAWIEKGLIPNATLDPEYIPESARKPYTRARAKNAKAIYCSIVKATINRYHVMPQNYGICKAEFEAYVDKLVEAKLIDKRVTDGITYYDATITALKIKRETLLEFIERSMEGISRGVTGEILENQFN